MSDKAEDRSLEDIIKSKKKSSELRSNRYDRSDSRDRQRRHRDNRSNKQRNYERDDRSDNRRKNERHSNRDRDRERRSFDRDEPDNKIQKPMSENKRYKKDPKEGPAILALNMPASIKVEEASILFGQYGEIEKINIYWISDRVNSCNVKVFYRKEESCKSAVDSLNEAELDNHKLKVILN